MLGLGTSDIALHFFTANASASVCGNGVGNSNESDKGIEPFVTDTAVFHVITSRFAIFEHTLNAKPFGIQLQTNFNGVEVG